jgi:Leucine-rich repeat (LRR) protein
MTFASAHPYRKLHAAYAAATTAAEAALQSGDLNTLTSNTEILKRTTAEFRGALARDLIEIPGKGRLIRIECEALQELAQRNQINICEVLDRIRVIEGGRVKALNLCGHGLTSIGALAKLTGLTTLDLGYNRLTEITPLAKVTGLTELYLPFNELTDITPLKFLTRLKTLGLFRNQLTDPANDPTLAALKANGCEVWT